MLTLARLCIPIIGALAVFSAPSVAISGEPATVDRNFGVGDLVYSVELKEPLPNLFGKPDIFGRKRTKGLIELRYVGLASPGHAVFHRRDTSVMTNESTMNRSHHFAAYGSSFGSSGVVVGSVSDSARVETLPPDTVEIVVDIAADPTLLINGHEIRVLEATPSRVRVHVEDGT